MSDSTSKRKGWVKKARAEGCEMCGKPESEVGKLIQTHIIPKRAEKKGWKKNRQENIFMLCPQCQPIFDNKLLPKILAILKEFNDGLLKTE